MTRTSQLWLLRHASVQVPPGTCYGQLDLPADPGATQASAKAIANALPSGIHIRCSTLQRCEQLAQSVSGLRPDLTLEFDTRLRELHFGRWEGRAWSDIAKSEIDAWAMQLATHAPGNGETLQHMLARVHTALCDTFPHGQAHGDAAWLSHAGVARCVQWLLGPRALLPPCSTHWPLQAPALGGWAIYDVNDEVRARLWRTAPGR